MPRRRQSLFEDFLDVAAKLPWWASIILAVVTYLIFHSIAAMDITVSPDPKQIGISLSKVVIGAVATLMQYGLPAAFVLGALVSIFSGFKARRQSGGVALTIDVQCSRQPVAPSVAPTQDLYDVYKAVNMPTAPPPDRLSLELLRAIDWKRFEETCAEYFRLHGFHAVTQSCGPDGGIDIKLSAPGSPEKIECVVQCKQWTREVGPKLLRELLGVMTANKVSSGIFVTSSTFNEEASRFASQNRIKLIDGRSLLRRILELPPEDQQRLLKVATEGDYLTPTCASCGIKMTLRTNGSDGSKFWGCFNYPRCKSKLQYTEVGIIAV